MKKSLDSDFKFAIEYLIYIIACIATCGLLYLIRIVITNGVFWALARRDECKEAKEKAEELEKAYSA